MELSDQESMCLSVNDAVCPLQLFYCFAVLGLPFCYTELQHFAPWALISEAIANFEGPFRALWNCERKDYILLSC